jgi:hypothetical protein
MSPTLANPVIACAAYHIQWYVANVVEQTNVYQYFRVMPADALGWDLRLVNVLSGSPN